MSYRATTESDRSHIHQCTEKVRLVVAICEVTSVETLVERLRSKQLRSKEEVLSRMRKEAEDDDIQTGAATVSLKCPFSYMRITTPCRSIHCSHVQCFDAESFFSINEQSPSWTCPICQRSIKLEELLMDAMSTTSSRGCPKTRTPSSLNRMALGGPRTER